jgi:hypothetical protein
MASRVYPSLASSPDGIKEIVVLAVFYPLSVAAIVLRVGSRFIKRKRLELNDYAALLALLLTSGLAVVNLMGKFATTRQITVVLTYTAVGWAGAGHHMIDIDPRYQARIFVLFAAGQPIWAAANTAVKFSILHLYITIFPSQRVQWICYSVMVLSICYWISVFLETFLLCTPVEFNWDKTIAGTCNPNALTAYVVAASINLVIDVFIVVLPIPLLWRLQMSLAKRLGTISLFSLGAVLVLDL